MAVTWQWKDKMGEITCNRNGVGKYKLSVYTGNCIAVFVYHYKEKGEKYYTCHGFFGDKAHMKRCLGLEKGCDNIYKDEWQKIKLNTHFKNSIVLAEAFAKAGYKVELYHQEIK